MGFPVFTLATEDLRKLSEQGTERRLPREGRRLGGERELLSISILTFDEFERPRKGYDCVNLKYAMIDDIKELGRLALHRLILVVIPEAFTFHRRFYAGSLFYYFHFLGFGILDL